MNTQPATTAAIMLAVFHGATIANLKKFAGNR